MTTSCSTPRVYASTPCSYRGQYQTHVPCYSADDSCELPRHADQSYLDLSTDHLLTDQPSIISQRPVDYSLLDISTDHQDMSIMCSVLREFRSVYSAPGSPMSMYFPGKRGADLSDELLHATYRDDLCCPQEPDLNNNNQTSPATLRLAHDIMSQLSSHDDHVTRTLRESDPTLASVRRHLAAARDHYVEVIHRWYWSSIMELEHEERRVTEQRQEQAHTIHHTIADMRLYVEEHLHQDDLTCHADHITQQLQELQVLIQSLNQSVSTVSFTVGRPHLISHHLGGVLIQRRPGGQSIPHPVLPGRCLTTFDSRRGAECDYMATGLSLTSCGDIIVTDTGLDCVNVFSRIGELKLNINTTPEDYPTTAVQYRDLLAVACTDQVKLYDMVEGVYHTTQLSQSLTRPQGVTTDTHGHLVVSAQRVKIPAIGVYDNASYQLSELVIGSTKCDHTSDNELFSTPWYITASHDDQFIISDRNSHCIQIISHTGELVEQIGSLGAQPGQFFHPAGTCTDPQGRIIVADSQNHRVQVVTPGGGVVLSILTQEHDDITCPMDVALDHRGRLYVLQGDGVVRVYQYC